MADRYRILRYLSHGGMGEVYEALDLELRERVALKTIRPSLAEDEQVIERFKREIQLAHKVTHPSVCRTFDLGTSPAPGRSRGDLPDHGAAAGRDAGGADRPPGSDGALRGPVRWYVRWPRRSRPRTTWASSTGTSRART